MLKELGAGPGGQVLQAPGGAGLTQIGQLRGELEDVVSSGLANIWRELLAVEQVVHEISDHFDGEEPIEPPGKAGDGSGRSWGSGLSWANRRPGAIHAVPVLPLVPDHEARRYDVPRLRPLSVPHLLHALQRTHRHAC